MARSPTVSSLEMRNLPGRPGEGATAGSPQADTIASTHLRDDGLAFELPLVLRQLWICEDHPDQRSAPSPRTRFAVRAVRR